MKSAMLLRNYITKYISFKGIEKEACRLEAKYSNHVLPIFCNREITILLHLLTPIQLNGLIRNTLVMMKCMNVLIDDAKIPLPVSSFREDDVSKIDYVIRVCKTVPLMKEYLVIALYTYF